MATYIVKIEGEDQVIKDNNLNSLDVHKIHDSKFHVLQNNQAYTIEVLQADFVNKQYALLVNGNSYEIKISDNYDQVVDKMGLLVGNSQKVKDIKAPMPGLIIDVMVKEGQEISEGTPLIILSAMKMENILLAQADGIIKSINVKNEDTVDKGQIIIEIE